MSANLFGHSGGMLNREGIVYKALGKFSHLLGNCHCLEVLRNHQNIFSQKSP